MFPTVSPSVLSSVDVDVMDGLDVGVEIWPTNQLWMNDMQSSSVTDVRSNTKVGEHKLNIILGA